ncbi:MAG: DsbA family protein, partial [Dehalococcoidia bacterium]|nr:DsbA family protein [Dehalococcoidia bacterium]
KGENQGTFSNSKLKGFASDLGLDRAAFDACLDSGRMASKLNQDYNEGMSKGVQATPTFFVKVAGAAGNGQKIEGAYPYSNFQAAIESALKQAQ